MRTVTVFAKVPSLKEATKEAMVVEHIVEAELKQLLDDTLPLERQTVIIQHLDGCDECRQRMCDYADLVAGLPRKEIHPDYSDSLAREIQSAAEGMRATNLDTAATSEATLQRVRSIGVGGFGQVFEYKDLRFNRSVAVKVLQDRWVMHPDVVQRFLREMELTAEIDHPGCPAVYGSGKTNDGRDFFWMQLVTGDSLNDVIRNSHQSGHLSLRRGDSTLRPLLATFIQICDVIQVAHEKDILHRDLKPANIRQHANHHPVVLDWGLAVRQYSAEPSPKLVTNVRNSTELTQVGDRLGSLAFMSPEAASGEITKITKATDIYALGGVLYAILTGNGPHQDLIDKQGDVKEILQSITTGHQPSLVGLPAELASICRKALSQKIEERYTSARDLARDVDQWLAGEPVKAHRYGTLGLVGLAVRRRPKTAVMGSLALGLLILLSFLGFTWRQDAVQQRLIAENRFGLALNAWQQVVSGVQDDLSMSGGTGEVRRRLIERSTEGISQLLVDAGKQPGAELVAMRAELELAALKLKEKGEVAAAKEIYQRIKTQLESDKEYRNLPTGYKLLGDATKGLLLCTQSEAGMAAAKPLLSELLRVVDEYEKRFPGIPAAVLMSSQVEVLAGRMRQYEGVDSATSALRHYQTAEEKLRQLPPEVLEQPAFSYELMLVQSEQADVFHELGQTEDAVRIQREIVSKMEVLSRREPNRRNRIGLISDKLNFGIYLKRKSLEEAAKVLEEALEAAIELKKLYTNDVVAEQLVRQVEANLAGTYRAVGRPKDAVRLLKGSVESVTLDFAKDDLDKLDDFAISWGALGNAYVSINQASFAADAYYQCVRIRSAIMDRNPQDLANRNKLLSVAVASANHVDSAQQSIIDGLVELSNRFDDQERERFRASGQLAGIGLFYQHLGMRILEQAEHLNSLEKAQQAYATLMRARAIIREIEGPSVEQVRLLEQQLENANKQLRRLDEQEPPN